MKIKTITMDTWEQVNHDDPKWKPGEPLPMVRVWRVIKVTDSIEFNPRQILTKAQVDELCSSSHWKVIIQTPKEN